MREKKDDSSLIDVIEGLLFSDEYADSEDNSSIISEIASSEIPEDGEESDENADTSSKSEADEGDSEKTGAEENVLNIDETENLFENDFDFASVEKIRNSIWTSRKINRSAVGLAKPKNSVREAQTLRDSVGGCKEQNCPFVGSEKARFFIRRGFEPESLREFVWDKQDAFKPLIESGYSIFPMGDVSRAKPFFDTLTCVEKNKIVPICQKETSATVEKNDDSKSSYALVETYKVLRQPSKSVEKSNASIDLEKKKDVARGPLCADCLNNFVETHKETGLITERSSSDKRKLLNQETNCIEKLKPSSSIGKTKFSIKTGMRRENVTNDETSVGFQKSSVQKKNSEIACEFKENSIHSTNVEKTRDPLSWEKTNCLVGSEKASAIVRNYFETELICRKQTNKNVKSFLANSEIAKKSVSLNETKVSVASENRTLIENIDQTKNFECSEKKKTILNEKKSAKTLRDSVECNESNNESFANIKKNEEIADAGKSKASLNKKKSERIDVGVAPSQKTNGLKKEQKNIASSSAVSITANNNLDLVSSANKKQEKNFFSTKENRKKNLPRKKAFDDFNKGIEKQTSQIRVSSFPLKNDGFVSKLNGDRTFEKKEMSLLYDKRKTAYKNMERDFKYKKDLF